MITVIQILFLVFFVYLAVNILYLLIFAIAGKLRNYIPYQPHSSKKRIAVFIPSYKEDNVIIHTALKAKQHNYPAHLFDVFIAADQLKPETVNALLAIPVNVQVMNFNGHSSKAKSLNVLFTNIADHVYDIVMILDGDNVMEPGCLEKVNAAFQAGFRCVQLHRTAKNADKEMAVLDGLSEEINNTIFRNGQRTLGLSSCLIGSGMAFEFQKLKSIIGVPSILDNPGEDREIDSIIIKEGIEIEYIPDANVYDEKVGSEQVFQRQRLRWMEAQLNHMALILSPSYFKGRRDRNFWNRFIVVSMPPRVLLIAVFIPILLLGLVSSYYGFELLRPSLYFWIVLFVALCASMLIALPTKYLKWSVMSMALSKFFSAMLHMVTGLFKLKRGRKEFLHTPKSFTEEMKEVV
ncbi:MAG TPA: glycosyltransferase family 2 protein [Chitinophagaceae bacterium]|nr:glycosyltransferase family 2 protein [Chitinophagaceae bacterium]